MANGHERFSYPFKAQSSYSTVLFVQMAIKHFGYQSQIIQTDSGFKFTHFKETKQAHPLDMLCPKLSIKHKIIRTKMPKHNGKVKRSHIKNNRQFHRHLNFYSYDDLFKQVNHYLYISN